MKYEDSEKVLSQIKKEKKIPPIVVLLSDDSYQCDIFFSTYKQIAESTSSNIDIITINGLEGSASQFHAELTTIPLFSSDRFIIIRHADTLLKNIMANTVVFKYFERDLINIPSCNRLLLQFDDTFPKGFDFLKKIAIVSETRILYEKDLYALIERKVESWNKKIDYPTIQLLIEKCSGDSKQVLKKLDQIVLYTMQKERITKEDIQLFCADLEGDLYFTILDYIAEKKISRCLQKINQHKFLDGSVLMPGIIKIFTDAFRYSSLRKIGADNDTIRKSLGLDTQNFIAKKNEARIHSTVKNYPYETLKYIFNALHALDQQFKMEPPIKHKTLLILFISSLSMSNNRTS